MERARAMAAGEVAAGNMLDRPSLLLNPIALRLCNLRQSNDMDEIARMAAENCADYLREFGAEELYDMCGRQMDKGACAHRSRRRIRVMMLT
jgi:hypothetical protein